MGKKRSLSEAQRAQIVILRQERYTERTISEHLTVSKTAVHQAVVKFTNCGSYSDCKRSGHPRKTTRQDDNLIKRSVVKSPTCSAKQIQAELGETGSRIIFFLEYNTASEVSSWSGLYRGSNCIFDGTYMIIGL